MSRRWESESLSIWGYQKSSQVLNKNYFMGGDKWQKSTSIPAMTRFCQAEGIDKVRVLSDHRDASFGTSYGVLIKELRLLARSIFIIDKHDRIAYIQIVPEITHHPDYNKALEALRELTGSGT